LERNLAVQHRHGVPSRLIDPAEISSLAPALAVDGLLGGSFCAEDAYADDAHHVAVAFAEAARRLGARVALEEALDFRRDGSRVVAVATRSGITACSTVINAAGQDASILAARLGISLPIQLTPRRIAFTNRIDKRLLEPLVVSLDRRVAIKQLTEGSFLAAYLGPLEGEGGDRAAWEFLERTASAVAPLVPLLADLDLSRQMVGVYDDTPDHQAILGDVDEVPGYVQAVGLSGHGFMLAPAIAEEIADLVLEGRRSRDLDTLSLNRFATGRLVPEPGVI
jgi:sarcosine oxidase subunit beta